MLTLYHGTLLNLLIGSISFFIFLGIFYLDNHVIYKSGTVLLLFAICVLSFSWLIALWNLYMVLSRCGESRPHRLAPDPERKDFGLLLLIMMLTIGFCRFSSSMSS